MADLYAPPVAAQTNAPNPQQGMQALSSIIGLKQQQQNLQTGAYIQQQQQAGAQQQQQAMAERQMLQQAMQSGKDDQGNSLLKSNGEVDPNALVAFANRRLPLTGQQVVQNIVKTQSDKIGLADSSRALADNYKSDLAGIVRSNPDPAQVVSGLKAYGQQNPQAAPTVQYASDLAQHLQNMPEGQQRESARLHLVQLLQPSSETQKEQGQSQESYITKQGQLGTRQTNPLALGVPTGNIPGAEVAPGLGPTDMPAYKGAVAAASAGAATRATGTGNADIDRANEVSANVKSSVAGIQTTQQIDDLVDQIHSGKFVASISKVAASAGLKDSTYARQLLEKDLGAVKTQLTAAAPSDTRAATILSGTPEATSDPQTVHGAMDYVRGGMRQNLAQGENLQAYRAKHPDLSGFQGADQTFTSAAGPLIHEFKALKTPAERSAFYARNFPGGPQDAVNFRNSANAAWHVLGKDNASK